MSIYDEIYHSPNFGYPKGAFGRNGHKIEGICLHITGAHWKSNYSWIMNSAANASYNAVIKDDGTVVSLVPEQNAAYSHGRINKATWPLLKSGVNPNLYTLSLARTGSNQNTWTPEQLASTLYVLKHWGRTYDLPLKRPYVFGHFEIDSVGRWYCPGEGFFEQVIRELSRRDPDDDPVKAALWHRVIAGSFRNPDYARRRVEHLKNSGIEAFMIPFNDPDSSGSQNIIWHRVIAGSFRDPENARVRAGALCAKGIDAFVVRYPGPERS